MTRSAIIVNTFSIYKIGDSFDAASYFIARLSGPTHVQEPRPTPVSKRTSIGSYVSKVMPGL